MPFKALRIRLCYALITVTVDTVPLSLGEDKQIPVYCTYILHNIYDAAHSHLHAYTPLTADQSVAQC